MLEGAGVLEGASAVGGIAEAVLVASVYRGVLLTAVGEGAGVSLGMSAAAALDCKEGVGGTLAT